MSKLPRDPARTLSRRRVLGVLGGIGATSALGLLSACGGSGEDLEAIAPNLYETTAGNQAATYRNVDRVNATRRFARGATVSPLPAHAVSLQGLQYDAGTGPKSIDEYMILSRTGGLLILKDG